MPAIAEPNSSQFTLGDAHVFASAHPLLSPDVRDNVQILLARLKEHACRSGIPLHRTEVVGHFSPEEPIKRLVIRQVVGLSAAEALDYWDTLEQPLTEWLGSLGPKVKALATELISLEVAWV